MCTYAYMYIHVSSPSYMNLVVHSPSYIYEFSVDQEEDDEEGGSDLKRAIKIKSEFQKLNV
jgi:hypothetical protein